MPDYDGFLPASLARGTGNLRQQTERLIRELQNRILDMEQGIDFVVLGDVYSSNWDGDIPADLSSEDAGAGAGYYLDSSVGSLQLEGDLFLGGELTAGTITGAEIRSAASGYRVRLDPNAPSQYGLYEDSTLRGYLELASATDNTVLRAETHSLLLSSAVDIALTATGNITLAGAGGFVSITGGVLQVQDGSAGSPGTQFRDDPDTGTFRPGANIMGVSLGGSEFARFQSGVGLRLKGGEPFEGVRVRGFDVGDKTTFTAVSTWEDWGSAQNMGVYPNGATYWVGVELIGSALVAAGVNRAGQVRVGISDDGGSSWTYGQAQWFQIDDATGSTRRGPVVAGHGMIVTADGTNNIQVKAQALISGGVTTDLDLLDGQLMVQVAPD